MSRAPLWAGRPYTGCEREQGAPVRAASMSRAPLIKLEHDQGRPAQIGALRQPVRRSSRGGVLMSADGADTVKKAGMGRGVPLTYEDMAARTSRTTARRRTSTPRARAPRRRTRRRSWLVALWLGLAGAVGWLVRAVGRQAATAREIDPEHRR